MSRSWGLLKSQGILCSCVYYPGSLTQATNTSNVSKTTSSKHINKVLIISLFSLYRSGSCLQLSRRHYCKMRCGIPACFERGIHSSLQYLFLFTKVIPPFVHFNPPLFLFIIAPCAYGKKRNKVHSPYFSLSLSLSVYYLPYNIASP